MGRKKTKEVKDRKTKKGNKPEMKQDKKQKTKMAEISSDLWELKLKRTEQDLAHYQKEYYNKASENEQLRGILYKTEKSYCGTTGYWQNELKERDKKIQILTAQLKMQQEFAIKEKLEWENQMKQQFQMFDKDILNRKATEVRIETKIANMRKQMHVSKKEYMENLRKKDEKYSLLEKETAEREMNHKCNDKEIKLLKLDHEKAITQLERELENVHKEKSCLSEKLKTASAKIEDLRQVSKSLSKDKLSLAVDKRILTSTLKENIGEMALKEKMLAEVRNKAASLEQALKKMEGKMAQMERRNQRNQVTIQASEVELDKLQKIIAMREKELYQVRQLARTIVEKRKDMEVFFHEALDHVRQEIAEDRKRYREDAHQDYRRKFRDGIAGRTKLPPIRTFHQCTNSTNSVYSAMKAAEILPHPPSKEVYMSDLTWVQKEKVLTLLFAKMNGNAESSVDKNLDLCESCRKQKGLLTPKPLNAIRRFSDENVH